MTVLKHGGKLELILLAVLLSTPPVTAEQREQPPANAPDSSSQSEGPSSEAKESSSGETKRTSGERSLPSAMSSVLKLLKEAKRDPGPAIQIEEKGDTIIFKRPSPFGLMTWTKKRSELTPDEQQMLRAHQARQAQDRPDEQQQPSGEAAPASVEEQQAEQAQDGPDEQQQPSGEAAPAPVEEQQAEQAQDGPDEQQQPSGEAAPAPVEEQQAEQAQDGPDEQQQSSTEADPAPVEAQQADANDDRR